MITKQKTGTSNPNTNSIPRDDWSASVCFLCMNGHSGGPPGGDPCLRAARLRLPLKRDARTAVLSAGSCVQDALNCVSVATTPAPGLVPREAAQKQGVHFMLALRKLVWLTKAKHKWLRGFLHCDANSGSLSCPVHLATVGSKANTNRHTHTCLHEYMYLCMIHIT